MAEFASTDMAHHAALAPNSPDGAGPQPSHSSERCGPPRPSRTSVSTTGSTHLPQCSGWSPSEDLQPLAQLHRGERKLVLSQRLFNRSLVAMNRYSGLSALSKFTATADPCPHDAPQPCGTGLPVFNLGHRIRRHSTPTANSITPPLVSDSSAVTPADTPPYPTSTSPSGRQLPQRFGQHAQLLVARRNVAVPKLRMDQLEPLDPEALGRAPPECVSTTCSC